MLSFRASLALILTSALLVPPAFAARAHKSSARSHARSASSSGGSSKAHASKATSRGGKSKSTSGKASKQRGKRVRGQQAIEPERVTQIQEALVREHYLDAEPNGRWDSTTQAAMQKYQSDQGWQTRLMPDSRALKKLGLGPDYSSAINAAGSNFGPPAPASTIPAAQASGFAAAAHVDHK